MKNINLRKREAYRRRVQSTLQEILNDPHVMPNANCEDLVVSVIRVEFGNTVRDIFVEVFGHWRVSLDQWEENPHDRYLREAKERGEETYDDLTDVMCLEHLRRIVATELQKRLGLQYEPRLHKL